MLSTITKKYIENKLGSEIRYPSDFQHLVNDIKQTTKQSISVNTAKRLFGVIKSTKEVRLTTLDIIAQYIGFRNWDIYIVSLLKESAEKSENTMLLSDLTIGTKVIFQYHYKQIVAMQYIKENTFQVVESNSNKLHVKDIVNIAMFNLHYPLCLYQVSRDDINIGEYIIAQVSGLQHVEIIG